MTFEGMAFPNCKLGSTIPNKYGVITSFTIVNSIGCILTYHKIGHEKWICATIQFADGSMLYLEESI